MRRMARRRQRARGLRGSALNGATAASVILFVAACGLWVRSYWTADVVTHRGDQLWQAVAADGRVYVQSVGYVERVGELVRPAGPAGRSGPPAPLTRYTDTPGKFLDRLGRLGRVPPGWRWAADRTAGWRWTSEPPTRGVPRWLVAPLPVGGLPATTADPAPRWPGTRAVTFVLVARRSTRTATGVDGRRVETVSGEDDLLTGRTVWLPVWTIVAAAAVLPASRLGAWWVGSRRRAGRSRANRCPACGYDLRATPGRCPECGAAPTNSGSPPPGREPP